METNLTEVYLDNSATTRCSERAKDLMVKVLMEDYGNPSSLHMKGVEAENYIKEAKKKIAKTLKVDEKEILFTSGGTESNNTALIGAALANKRGTWLSSDISESGCRWYHFTRRTAGGGM